MENKWGQGGPQLATLQWCDCGRQGSRWQDLSQRARMEPCAVWTQWWRAPKSRDIGPGGRVRLPLALAVLSGFISSCPPRAPTVTPAPASSCHPPSPRPPSALSCVSLPVSQAAINPAGPGLLQGSWAPAGGAGPPARRPCPAQLGLSICFSSVVSLSPGSSCPGTRSGLFTSSTQSPSPALGQAVASGLHQLLLPRRRHRRLSRWIS